MGGGVKKVWLLSSRLLFSTILGLVMLAMLALSSDMAEAATYTWNGHSPVNNNFSEANWTTAAPTDLAAHSFVFNTLSAPFRTTANNDLAGNPDTFTFNAGAAAMTITGNALQFAGSSPTPIVNNSANLQTFSADVRQFWFTTADKKWNAASGNLSFGTVNLRGDAGATQVRTLTIDGAYNTTISGIISLAGWSSGGASLIKAGNGILTLNNNSSFDTVKVSAGTLRVAGGTLSTTKQLAAAPGLGFELAAGTLEVAGGNINVGTYGLGSYSPDTGTLNVTAGDVTIAGALIVGWNSSPTFTVSGGTVTTGSIRHQDANAGILTISGTGVVTAGNVYHDANGVGIDSLTLNLNTGGTLVATNLYMALGATAQGAGTHSLNVNFDGGTLKARADTNLVFATPAGTSTRAINLTVKAGGAIIDTNGKTVDILQPFLHDSSLGVTPDGGLTKTGTGTLTNSSIINTFTGNTTLNEGTLVLGNSHVIPDGASYGNVIFNPASGSATLNVNGKTETINGLSSSGAGASVVNNSTGSGALTVGGNDATSVFGGVIQNSGGTLTLTKTGTGALTLSGANTYTGPTAINAGTLLVNESLAAGSAVTVNSGGTLGGTGTVYGTITLQSGSTNAPGAEAGLSRGVFTAASNVTFQSGSVLAININSSQNPKCDTLNVGRALDITGATLNLTISGTMDQAAYVIASYGSLVGGTFAATTGLPADYAINYAYNSTNIAFVLLPRGTVYSLR
jgi:autotransporter-associated beta strand protein